MLSKKMIRKIEKNKKFDKKNFEKVMLEWADWANFMRVSFDICFSSDFNSEFFVKAKKHNISLLKYKDLFLHKD